MAIGTPAASTRAQSATSTSARAAKPKKLMVRKGVRVSVKRKHVKNSLDIASAAWDCIKELHDDYQLYGSVTGKAVGSCFPVKFDILPHGQQEYMIPRKSIKAIEDGADEPEYDHVEAEEERIADELGTVPQPTPRLGKHNNPDLTPPVVRYMKNGKLANEKGKAYQRFCYICRTYGDNRNTQWACRECNMPLCNYNTDRRGEGEWACLMEHKQSVDEHDGCGHRKESFIVPDSRLKPGLKRGRSRKRVIRDSSDDNNDGDGRKDGSDDGGDDNNDNGRNDGSNNSSDDGSDNGSDDGAENNFIAYRLRTRN